MRFLYLKNKKARLRALNSTSVPSSVSGAIVALVLTSQIRKHKRKYANYKTNHPLIAGALKSIVIVNIGKAKEAMTVPHEHKVILTTDVVILTVDNGALKALLMTRPNAPFEGCMALPGGFVHQENDATTEDAARRILKDKLGLQGIYVEKLSSFSGATRDPRGWSLSDVYLALVPNTILGAISKKGVTLVDVSQCEGLAFDHDVIVAAAAERIRRKSEYSTLPAEFLSESFTLPELRKMYEVVLNESILDPNFRRKVLALEMLEATGETTRRGGIKKPAALYRVRDGVLTFSTNFKSK